MRGGANENVLNSNSVFRIIFRIIVPKVCKFIGLVLKKA